MQSRDMVRDMQAGGTRRRGFWARLRRCTRGSVAAETAVIVPILIMMALGGTEIARYVLLHQKLNRIAVTMSDLVSQAETISEAELAALFAAVDPVMKPFDVGDKGILFVSSITASDGNPPRVSWQRSGGGSLGGQASQFGAEGSVANLPTGFQVRDGETVIVAEMIYSYSPMFTGGFVPGQSLYHRALFRPRFGNLNTIEP